MITVFRAGLGPATVRARDQATVERAASAVMADGALGSAEVRHG
jgi:hypothetical protein